jgi:hypothetical protein
MSIKILHRIVIGGFIVTLFGAPVALLLQADLAVGTTDSMMILPAYAKFKCALCHVSATPREGSSELNPFGVDFVENGRVWDKTLAMMNSDGDKCLNGFELGDEDGNGVFDYGGEAIENSNPGDEADCSIALTKGTWGIIKNMFKNELPDYLDEDLEEDTHGDWSLHFP